VCIGQVQDMEGAEAPDVFTATWTLNYCNSYYNGWSVLFQEMSGSLILDGNGFRIYNEPWAKRENREPIYKEAGGTSDVDHCPGRTWRTSHITSAVRPA
jgi:hypothetical protein